MRADDPLPIPVEHIDPEALVADVVLTEKMTPFLMAAQTRGCKVQVGMDMLFEQIPAYLEFFGLGTTTATELRAISALA